MDHYECCWLCGVQIGLCCCKNLAAHTQSTKSCKECKEEFEVEYNAGD